MNSALEAALSPVVRDLRSTGGITLRVLDEPTDDDPGYESMWMLSAGEMRTGLLARVGMAEYELLVHVAEQVQDFVHEELWRLGQPATWPECLEHPASHPLMPASTSSGAAWNCPKSGAIISPIGEL